MNDCCAWTLEKLVNGQFCIPFLKYAVMFAIPLLLLVTDGEALIQSF